jgi:hypothetical protein
MWMLSVLCGESSPVTAQEAGSLKFVVRQLQLQLGASSESYLEPNVNRN